MQKTGKTRSINEGHIVIHIFGELVNNTSGEGDSLKVVDQAFSLTVYTLGISLAGQTN